MIRVKMPTPYAEVIIEISKEDMWAQNEIIEWIFHNCGLKTENDFAKAMQKFNIARENIKREVNNGR